MISLSVLILLGIAAYRLTQLGVHDSILDPGRERLADWHAKNLDSKPRGFLMQLIGCVYCLGWWMSGAALGAYLLATGTWGAVHWLGHGIEWFAVSRRAGPPQPPRRHLQRRGKVMGLRQLVSAAARYSVKTAKKKSGNADSGWQEEAWKNFKTVPEVRFAGTWVGSAMGGATLIAGRRTDSGAIEPLR